MNYLPDSTEELHKTIREAVKILGGPTRVSKLLGMNHANQVVNMTRNKSISVLTFSRLVRLAAAERARLLEELEAGKVRDTALLQGE